MKRISMFIMILICMVSFTSTATTAKMEQKQKSEFVKTFIVESNAASVVNEINVVSVLTDAAIKNEIKVRSFEAKQSNTYMAIIAAVGWRKSNQLLVNIPYTEKLLKNPKNDLKFCEILKQNRIQENPFAVNQSFIYKRNC